MSRSLLSKHKHTNNVDGPHPLANNHHCGQPERRRASYHEPLHGETVLGSSDGVCQGLCHLRPRSSCHHHRRHESSDDENTSNINQCCCDEFDIDFAAGTTCHGVYFVCNPSWSWYRRIFWLLLVVCSLGLLATQLHDRFVTFLKFELKTEVAIESARSLPLPTITLCNTNFFSKKSLQPVDFDLIHNVTYTLSADIMGSMRELSGAGLPANWTVTYWKAAEEYEVMENKVLQKHSFVPNGRPVDVLLRKTGWQIKPEKASGLPSPIIQCRVGRHPCRPDDFKPVLMPEGVCYSLNNPPHFVQEGPHVSEGVNLFLDVHQDDNTMYNLEGSFQFECGMKVILHEWYERPDMGLGVAIPPGMSGIVAIKGSKRQTTPKPPWSNCVKSANLSQPYSEKQCLTECEAQQTLRDCACRLWYEPGNATLCTIAKTTACLLYKKIVRTHKLEIKCKSACLEACDVTSYSSSISYTNLASNATIRELTYALRAQTGDGRYTDDYVRKNVIALQIAFAQLVIDRTTSTPALEPSAFLSDIGGQLGLFAGISLITICELIEYPIAKLIALVTGNRLSATSPRTLRRRRRRQQYDTNPNSHHCNCTINNTNNNNNNNNDNNTSSNTNNAVTTCQPPELIQLSDLFNKAV